MSSKWSPTPKAIYSLRPYKGRMSDLTTADLQFFSDRYEIDELAARAYIRVGDLDRYLLPIYSPLGVARGAVLRRPWSGAPRRIAPWLPKADTFMSANEPVQSFYSTCGSSRLIMVEDQLSALKLAAHGYNSVAVLGTPYSDDPKGFQQADRVAELAREALNREFIVALDADATDAAFMFVRKWGYAFKKIRVAILEKDLKDTPAEDFGRILGV